MDQDTGVEPETIVMKIVGAVVMQDGEAIVIAPAKLSSRGFLHLFGIKLLHAYKSFFHIRFRKVVSHRPGSFYNGFPVTLRAFFFGDLFQLCIKLFPQLGIFLSGLEEFFCALGHADLSYSFIALLQAIRLS